MLMGTAKNYETALCAGVKQLFTSDRSKKMVEQIASKERPATSEARSRTRSAQLPEIRQPRHAAK